jgi:hypothetical protein
MQGRNHSVPCPPLLLFASKRRKSFFGHSTNGVFLWVCTLFGISSASKRNQSSRIYALRCIAFERPECGEVRWGGEVKTEDGD